MRNMNELKDGDITILRYRPCNKTYVKKENDDEPLYTKEEWIQKQSLNKKISKEELNERLATMKRIREKRLAKDKKSHQRAHTTKALKAKIENFKQSREL